MSARLRRSLLGAPRPLVAVAVPVLLVVVTAMMVLLLPSAPGAAPASATPTSARPTPSSGVGPPQMFAGPAYDVTKVHGPTREGGQAKLWHHAGGWWGVVLDPSTERLELHRLDPAIPAWVPTGLVVDERDDALVDVLPIGDSTFVVSAGRSPASPRDAVRLQELVYDPARDRYEPGVDMPIAVSQGGARSVIIDREADGRMWLATIVDERLVLRYAAPDGRTWTALQRPPGSAATRRVNQAALVALDGGIALVWTSPERPAVFVARHAAGDEPTTWTEAILEGHGIGGGPGQLDTLTVAGPGGDRLFMTVGTATEGSLNQEAPKIVLVVVEPDGSWRPYLVGRVADGHERPTLVADPAADRLFVMATASLGKGSTILIKDSRLSEIGFTSGVGLPLFDGIGLAKFDDSTATRQPVSAASGFVAIASDDVGGRYATALLRLGDGEIPGAGWTRPTDPLPLVRDRFDTWGRGAPIVLDWRVPAVTPGGRLALVDAPGRAGTALRLMSADRDRARGCRSFPLTGGGPVEVDAVVRLARIGGSDGAVAVRGGGDDTGHIRFDSDGTLAYFDGPEKINTTIAFQSAAWYRVQLRIDPATRTYDVTVERSGGARPLLSLRGVAWRSETAPASMEEVCFDVPAGAGSALDLDELTVEG